MDPISDSSHRLWWGALVKETGRANVNNPYGESIIQYGWRNLPDVYPCFCGGHPLPSGPVIQRQVDGYDGVARPARYLVTGMPRAGSTTLWQIMTLLSKGTTIKSHEFNDSCPLFFKYEKIFCTVRHPFDAIFSNMRLRGIEPDSPVFNTHVMDKAVAELYKFQQLQVFQECMGYRPDLDVYFLKYEDFWDNELEKIKHAASLMQVDCDDERAQQILAHVSIDKNKERSQYDPGVSTAPNAGVLAGHVGALRGKPEQGARLPTQLKKYIVENYSWIFEHFNYSTEI